MKEILVRPRRSLFHAEGRWFSANWHFNFHQYCDDADTRWRDLRLFNDDRLVPDAVWPMHPHREVEGHLRCRRDLRARRQPGQ